MGLSDDALAIIERTHCECGCGCAAPIAQRTSSRTGAIKGARLRFLPGHNRRNTSDLSRHEPVDAGYSSPCWRWTGALNRKGYGRVQVGGVHRQAHRALYERSVSPIASGLHLDHLCRNKWCVNPEHMEPVTPLVNERRKRSASALVVRMIEAS